MVAALLSDGNDQGLDGRRAIDDVATGLDPSRTALVSDG
jgi:hypothetical protein